MRLIPAAVMSAVLPLFAQAAPFRDYPAEVASSPFVRPDFEGKAKEYRSYRTRYTEGSDKAPDFAGRYVLVTFGCGTSCKVGGAVDRKTGAIIALPLGGEEYQNLYLYSRASSRLLKATWVKDRGMAPECFIGEFLLEGEEFHELSVKRHYPSSDCFKGPGD